MFKKLEWRIMVRVMALFATLLAAAFMAVYGYWAYLALVLPVTIVQLVDFYRFNRRAQEEVAQFVKSVHYRDFSRHFNVQKAPAALQPLRQGFNDINTAFKIVSRERETQYQYLQQILELVDTGILSYESETGVTGWMNETLKKMLGIPYLKTIHSLEKRDRQLYEELLALRPGDGKVVRMASGNIKVLLSATAFQTDGKVYKVIAFQNVDEALDENEAEAWKKLLSVMTHEIMNSVAPISSLADTLKNRLQAAARHLTDEEGTVDDLELGIITIKRRSEGLLKFAETYRNLNKITRLHLQKVYVRNLFGNLSALMGPTLEQKQIDLDIILKSTDLQIEVDNNLIEQVLINLLVNAMEAVKEKERPNITLSAAMDGRRAVIKITDNGHGMPPDILDKIFIPFFSTKKSGSGIGLSLCKQIMMMHKGSIQVHSIEGRGTSFSLLFEEKTVAGA